MVDLAIGAYSSDQAFLLRLEINYKLILDQILSLSKFELVGVTPSHYRSAFWKFHVSAPARSILSKHNEQEPKKTAHI